MNHDPAKRSQSFPTQPPESWSLPPLVRPRTILFLFVIAILLTFSARRTDVDQGIRQSFAGVIDLTEIDQVDLTALPWLERQMPPKDATSVGNGVRSFSKTAFPLVFEEREPVGRIANFDPENLPYMARLTEEPIIEYDFQAGQTVEVGTQRVLVQPLGYLVRVIRLMGVTIEIAIWGTLLSLSLSIPLAMMTARTTAPNRLASMMGRTACGFLRAMPELILALIFVLMYGFGAFAGVMALGVHTAGLLAKFFADDIENADPGPQEALRAIGAGPLLVLRYAIVPQILPQALAYTQYILERNVRSATVLGIVGAGGIGMELKGRWDTSEFGHVSTILLVIFLTVVILEQLTQRMRAKLI